MEIKISPSRLTTLKTCLGQYYFRYILKEPVQKTTWPATVMGTSIHSYIENYLPLVSKESDIKKLPPLSSTYQTEKSNIISSGEKIGKPRGYDESSFLSEHDVWVKDIMRFLFLFLPTGKKVFEEEINETINIGEHQLLINGFIDMQVIGEKKHVFDFKTTKTPQKYFFVHWSEDPQSLFYMASKKADSFDYLVFDSVNKIIISKGRSGWNESDQKSFDVMINDFLKLHQKSSSGDSELYSPSEENCRWCDYRSVCSRAIKK